MAGYFTDDGDSVLKPVPRILTFEGEVRRWTDLNMPFRSHVDVFIPDPLERLSNGFKTFQRGGQPVLSGWLGHILLNLFGGQAGGFSPRTGKDEPGPRVRVTIEVLD